MPQRMPLKTTCSWNCCVARAQAGVLLRRLKFALPGWTEAESRRGAWAQKSAQRAAQARAFSGEGHSEEWGFFFSGSSHWGGGVPEGRGARESSEGAGVAYMLRSRRPPKKNPTYSVAQFPIGRL